MPNVIDSWVLEFGLDPSKFTRGQKDALDAMRKTHEEALRAGKDVESEGKKISEFFVGLKRTVIGVVGGVELAGFIKNATDFNASMGRIATVTGESTQTLAAWNQVIGQIGGQKGEASAAIGGIADQLARLKVGGEVDPKFLEIWGRFMSGKSEFDYVNKPAEALLEIAEAMHKTGAAAPEIAYMLRQLHIPEPLVAQLVNGRKGMDDLLEKALKAAPVTKELSEDAQKFQTALGQLGTQAEGTGNAILEYLYKPMTKLLEAFTALIEKSPVLAGALAGLAGLGLFSGTGAMIRRILGTGAGAAAGAAGGGAGASLLGRAIGVAGSLPLAIPGFYFGSTTPANADEAGRKWNEPLGPPEEEAKRRTAAVAAHARGGARADMASPGHPNEPPVNFEGMDAQLRARLSAMWEAAPDWAKKDAGILSGVRSREVQAELYRRYLSGEGGIAAPPGRSKHEVGQAADIRDPSGWFHKNAGQFGIVFPLGAKDWPHAQAIPGWQQSMLPVGAGPAAQNQQTIHGRGGDTDNSSSMTITGDVNVHTSANDANGIARDIVPALRRTAMAMPFNQGLV